MLLNYNTCMLHGKLVYILPLYVALNHWYQIDSPKLMIMNNNWALWLGFYNVSFRCFVTMLSSPIILVRHHVNIRNEMDNMFYSLYVSYHLLGLHLRNLEVYFTYVYHTNEDL